MAGGDKVQAATSGKHLQLTMKERHQQWIQRGKFSTKAGSWRPRKVYRVAAKKWIMAIDLQLKSVTGGLGLSYLLPDPKDPWNARPRLSVAMDQGPDGNTGYHDLERVLKLLVDMWNDPSHGVTRDFFRCSRTRAYGDLLCVSSSP